MRDKDILEIKSPKKNISGPYFIVYKNLQEKWAIVTLAWDKKPRLGIRWFWGSKGNPNSRGNPTWFILPNELNNSILNGLPLSQTLRKEISTFLNQDSI